MISNFQYVCDDTLWIQRDAGMNRLFQANGFSLTVGGDFVPTVLVGDRTPTIGGKLGGHNLEYLKGTKSWSNYKDGWTNRINNMKKKAE